LIDGRNVWKTDLKSALSLAKDARERLGSERLLLAPSCSLLHVPVSLKPEKELDPELTRWLAFADEKLEELSDLAEALAGTDQGKAALLANEAALLSRRCSARVNNPAVQARLASLREEDFVRHSPFPERRRQQRERLALPLLPTTTIGSFPQTPAIREARAEWRRGVW